MDQATVVVIGGGATGTGIFRDLAMRGVDVVLLEQKDLAYGTSSRFHGLLHSGGRYAVKDAEAARECIEENKLLRTVAKHCVEETEGLFVRLPEDDEAFEHKWVEACAAAGIETTQISKAEALRLEPNLTGKMVSAYKVPDSAIDGFRLVWQNVQSGRRYGGRVYTYSEVVGVEQSNGKVTGVTVRNTLNGQESKMSCEFLVSAAGSWVGELAALAGIKVHVQPDRGTLIAFNHRFTNRVVNRLRPAGDADIFVPHGSIVILGTTSSPAELPDDTIPKAEEVLAMLDVGEKMFEDVRSYRLLRAFTGTRPLYSADPSAIGRAASRNFTILDHSKEGLQGFASIVGGKFTTYRLMAEKMADFVCAHLGVTTPCRTAVEPLVSDVDAATMARARKAFPAFGSRLAADRLGDSLAPVVEAMEKDPAKSQLVCECELVTLAEVEHVASDATSHQLTDVRRRTRMGMGTCQGAFCGLRGVGAIQTAGLFPEREPADLFHDFLQGRWNGIRPMLWGKQVKEAELMRGIYEGTLNVRGEVPGHEK